MQFNFSSLNLGCTKNLVDTQFLLWKFFELWWNNKNYNLNYFTDPFEKNVEFVFLNTCGFISSGRQEMFETIQKLLKKNKKIYLLWCGLQYFLWKNLKDEKKEKWETKIFDELVQNKNIFFLSWEDFEKITIQDLVKWYSSKKFDDFKYVDNSRAYTNSAYGFEYLKIAEWCNNNCSFCIIPKIRGKQKSLPMEKIIDEVTNMVKFWIKEIIFIAQDSTRYWIDLYWKPSLFELLKKIDKIPWKFMYRILYLYPDVVTLKQLKNLTKLKKFIPYFDIPLQHISSPVLKRMWRFYDEKYIYNFLDFINKNFKTKFIRTNLIIWFPWETEKDFKALCEFVQKYRFDNIALFEYHDEPLAQSSKLDWKINYHLIHKRFIKLKKLIEKLKIETWKDDGQNFIQQWFVMGFKNKSVKSWKSVKSVVRPWLNAPEIDPYVEIDQNKIISVNWKKNYKQINIWDLVVY